MRLSLFIGFIFCITYANAQLVPDRSIHDFQLIFEEDSVVSHEFTLRNKGEHPIRITAITPSCGCTVAELSETVLKPNQTSKLKASYNPEDRPGNFIKSIQIQYLYKDTLLETFVVLKGFTKNKAKEFQEHFVLDSLFVLPYDQNIAYPDNWVLDQARLNLFVNDLSYVIDYKHVVNAQIRIYTKLEKSKFTDQITSLKKYMYRLLDNRNYPSYRLTFSDEVFIDSTLPNNDIAYLQIRIPEYYKKGVSETLIYESNPNQIKKPERKTALPIIAYCPFDKKHPEQKSEREEFIKQVRRSALGQNPIILGGIQYTNSKTKQKKILKKVKKLKKEIIKQGITEDKFLKDTIIKMNEPGMDKICQFVPYLYEEDPPGPVELKLFDEEFFTFEEANAGQLTKTSQNLPAHFQQIRDYVQDLDTSNKYFISMMETVIKQIKNGNPIEFNIESSASKAPTDKLKASNDWVARMRSEEAKRRITTYLKDRGIRDSDIKFGRTINLVSGPEYDLQHYLIQYYYYFQYIKVIPSVIRESYETPFISPYKVNFSGNDLELNTESTIFQKFMDHLAKEIRSNGYVRLIIESSSSKVPVRQMGKNVHLSYHRAQEAKNQVYNEMKKRGINPTKVIFVEELILVQGPEFNRAKDKTSDKKYEPFQYVKIVPFSNIEER
jgi:hypothetical protein